MDGGREKKNYLQIKLSFKELKFKLYKEHDQATPLLEYT